MLNTCLDRPAVRPSRSQPVPAESIVPFRKAGAITPASLVAGSFTATAMPVSSMAPRSRRPASNYNLELTTYYPAALSDTYSQWTGSSHFPCFMRAIRGSCEPETVDKSWRLRLRGREVPWEAITVEKIPCKHIAWWSVGEGSHRNRGSVSFSPGGWRTTRIVLRIEFYESSVGAVTENTVQTLRQELEHALDLFHAAALTGPLLGPVAATL